MVTSAPVLPGSIAIPVDLFVSLKHANLGLGYKVYSRSSSHSSSHDRTSLDAAGNLLISMSRDDKGCWKGFKGNREELIFRMQRTKNTLTTTELEVFLADKNLGDSTPDFKVKGCPFMGSCTIYHGNDIVAQTNPKNKLNQLFVKRSKLRLTIFPRSVDHALIAALVAIFLKG